jgi:hypothetical protein
MVKTGFICSAANPANEPVNPGQTRRNLLATFAITDGCLAAKLKKCDFWL